MAHIKRESDPFQFLSPRMQDIPFCSLIVFFFLIGASLCKEKPEEPLYGGGLFNTRRGVEGTIDSSISNVANNSYVPSLVLYNLTQGTIYSFSAWVRVKGSSSAMVRTTLETEKETHDCIGTVSAKHECWSFLKGGFVLNWSSNLSMIFFQQRKRAVTIHVSDSNGRRFQGASICIEQISKDFPFGSAIAKTILGNLPYQNWFVKRFNAAVFENELKWYATEPDEGKVNYTISDQMLQFVRTNNIIARGHNIFWENPKYTPPWVLNLTGTKLQSAVNSRIHSLMSQYKDEFIHWDVSNEMLHFNFYEERLGPDATLHFFETAHESDPLATLFMNDFNVVETCSDVKSTVDAYISRVRELQRNGIFMDGIGLEGHFTIPNPPLIRAILDKLATLGLPIWLTEVDISKTLDRDAQANYLEEVLREGFSHPSVNGIMLWTAFHPNGCYQMCLTDNNFKNLPAGDVVDKLVEEWQISRVEGVTDVHGSYSFYGFLGEYRISVKYGNKTTKSTFSLSRDENEEQQQQTELTKSIT
ncbi:hypothetical protein JHK85_008918 [Glycine max]|nr:hypothetical protein JHK85_008918 [Glycine max]